GNDTTNLACRSRSTTTPGRLVLGRGDYPRRVQAAEPYSSEAHRTNQMAVSINHGVCASIRRMRAALDPSQSRRPQRSFVLKRSFAIVGPNWLTQGGQVAASLACQRHIGSFDPGLAATQFNCIGMLPS